MQCSGCEEQKLSNEFPHGRVTESCQHRPWCLRCVMQSYNKSKTCPGCSKRMEKEEYDTVCARLAKVAHEDQFEAPSASIPIHFSNVPSVFNVVATTLTGEQKEISVRGTDTESSLRAAVKIAFGIEPQYQRLFFNGKSLDSATKLIQQGVGPASRIQVQQVLLAIFSHSTLKNIEFELQWGYTSATPAYLNGSCLVYCGDQYCGAVDFFSTVFFTGIRHHGRAKIVYRNKIGRQAISIQLDQVHPNITQLYFVLSVCKAKSLAHFVTPTVNFYDTANPGVPLKDYNIASAGTSKAVIMCCLRRDVNIGWEVIACGRRSNGGVHNYGHITQTIANMMKGM